MQILTDNQRTNEVSDGVSVGVVFYKPSVFFNLTLEEALYNAIEVIK